MKTFIFLTLLTLAGCGTEAEKEAEPKEMLPFYQSWYVDSMMKNTDSAIMLGKEAIGIAWEMKGQRDSLTGLVFAYRYADSLNKLNHYHGNGIGWYSVNPWEKK